MKEWFVNHQREREREQTLVQFSSILKISNQYLVKYLLKYCSSQLLVISYKLLYVFVVVIIPAVVSYCKNYFCPILYITTVSGLEYVSDVDVVLVRLYNYFRWQ